MDFNSLKVNMDVSSNIVKYEKNDSYNKTNTTKENFNNDYDKSNVNISQDSLKLEYQSGINKNNKGDKTINASEKDNQQNKSKKNAYREKLVDAIEEANKKLLGVNRKFSYEVHDKTNKIMVKIMDSTTGEVLKEIPPEKELDMVAKMRELVGILVDEKR